MKKTKLTILVIYILAAFGLYGYLGFFSAPNKNIPCQKTVTLQDGSTENAERECTWTDSSLSAAEALIYIALPVGIYIGADKLIANRKK